MISHICCAQALEIVIKESGARGTLERSQWQSRDGWGELGACMLQLGLVGARSTHAWGSGVHVAGKQVVCPIILMIMRSDGMNTYL